MIDNPDESLLPGRMHLAVAGGLLAILLATMAIFWSALSGPFVFDDFPNLQNLAQLEGHPDRAHLGQYLAAFTGNPGRPLAALSFIIEDADWPTDPFPYKRDNLLFHLLAGVLLFELARRLAGQLTTSRGKTEGIALATAAIWLMHPMQLSATMLVVQRMNILSTIAELAGLIGYLYALRLTRWPEYGRVVLAGAVLSASATIAMLCKENGILVFAFASALNVTLLRPVVVKLSTGPRRLLLWGAALPILLVVAFALTQIGEISASYWREFTMGQRLLSESRILIDYLREIFLPRIGDQGIFHDGYVISTGLFSPSTTAICILVIGLLLGSAWWLRTRWPLYSFAVLWFFAGHLIESTIWPLELYFDHRNYLPMVGPLFAMVASVALLPRQYLGLGWGILSVWFCMVAGLTTVNARTWGDRGSLSAVWLQDNPKSPRAVQMMASYQADRGDLKGARRTLDEGFRRIPEAGELAMQSMFAGCVTSGLTRSQWNDLIALASRVRYQTIVMELVSKFGQQARGDRCHGTLQNGDFIRLSEAIVHNPAISFRGDALAYVYYEMGRQAMFEHDLDRTMAYLDLSYHYRANPLVARNQAIDLLSAGLPDDAMRYLRLSEKNTLPWFKRQMLDMPAMNARLWLSAYQMKRDLKARSQPMERRPPRPTGPGSSDGSPPQ